MDRSDREKRIDFKKMKWLLYGQGIFYAGIGTNLLLSPDGAVQDKHKEKFTAYGRLYAQLLGPAVMSFGIAGICMAHQPTSPAKTIFSLGWLGYHVGHTIIYFQKYLNAKKMEKGEPLSQMPITPCLIHAAFSGVFIYYLYKSYNDGLLDINSIVFGPK